MPSARQKSGLEPLDFYLAGLLAVSALSLYLRYPTRCYVLEGLARAIPMELGLFQRLLLGNYLLYGLVGDLFYNALRVVGFGGHAYVALQVMDGFFGAAGLFAFYLTARAVGTDRFFSCLWTSILGVSLGYWLWSTEAENYIFSAFLLQLNFLGLVLYCKTRRPSPWMLGFLQALAIFGHLVNGLFGLVALWIFVSTDPEQWPTVFLKYGAACVAVLGVGFGGALLVLKPVDSVHAVGWILGSAAGSSGHLHWHGSWWTMEGVREWLRMTVRIFMSLGETPYAHLAVWPWAEIFLKLAGVLTIFYMVRRASRLKNVWQEQKTFVVACGLWVALYAVIFSSWEPYTMVYRISDLVPLILLLALLSQHIPAWSIDRVLVAAIAVCLALGNFGAEIYPRSFWGNNPTWVYMQFLKSSTEDIAWIAGPAGADNIYTSYFAERRPLVLDNFRENTSRLKELLRQLEKDHQPVYVTSRALSDPYWENFFAAYSLQPRAQGLGVVLYRVTPQALSTN